MTATSPNHGRTLFLVAALHACTHIYHVALLPLYLLIQKDLKLESVEQATFLMSALMIAYYLPSYAMGVLADRYSRKNLLALGLLINGGAFIGLSYAQSYAASIAWVIVAGLGGSFYHPAATALVARLYPVGTGKALGLAGIGASVGFFFAPIYSGWRAGAVGWRAPVFELGLFSVVVAAVFYWLAESDHQPTGDAAHHEKMRKAGIPRTLLLLLFFSSLAFAMRDFAGNSVGSLGSLFLQKAHHFGTAATGGTLALIFLASAISNPLFGALSDRRRILWTGFVLVMAAIMVFVFPRVPGSMAGVAYAVYGFFFMASFPMVEAALMESTHDAIRGRVFGFFITVGGVVGNIAHWFVGDRVKAMGSAANSPPGYYGLYALLAVLILLSLVGLPLLKAMRPKRSEKP